MGGSGVNGLIFYRFLNNCVELNSSTIDELGKGAWKDSGATSTRAEHLG